MKILYKFTCVALAALLLTACGGGGSPESVTKDFWNAMSDGDIDGMKKYLTKADLETLEKAGDEKAKEQFAKQDNGIKELIIGKVNTTENESTVETTITAEDPSTQKDMTVSFETVLVKEEDAWKINMEKSMTNMVGAMMKSALSEMGES